MVKRKKVAKIQIELFEVKSAKSKDDQMDDKVDFYQGGKAKFQISNE